MKSESESSRRDVRQRTHGFKVLPQAMEDARGVRARVLGTAAIASQLMTPVLACALLAREATKFRST